MKVTYDDEAHASYIYFTMIGVGGVADTATYEDLLVELDTKKQIVGIRLVESEDLKFQNRLKFAMQHPEVEYRETSNELRITFAPDAIVERIVNWDGNIDLDRSGQILGVEILFTSPGYETNDGFEHLYAEGSLEHLAKYLVSFDEL